MTKKERTYREWYEQLPSDEQKKHLPPDKMVETLLENVGLPTAKDFMEARFQEDIKIYRLGKNVYSNLMKIADEAEQHRIDYNQRIQEYASTESFGYWKGRRDEAGYFRDAILAMIESLGK